MSLFNGKFNSKYFKAYYRGKKRLVFVENEDDVPFWKRWLSKFAPSEVFVIRPSVSGTSTRGKTEVLKLLGGEGAYLLLAVDSDYDYLLQDKTAISKAINSNSYIFQTYTYSIENYKCFSESLEGICIQASLNDNNTFDFPQFLRNYSTIIFPLLVYSIYSEMQDEPIFERKDFAELIGLEAKFNFAQIETIVQVISNRVREEVSNLHEKVKQTEIETLTNELSQLGLTPQNAYLFTQGHILFENVILKIVNIVAHQLSNQKYKQFEKEAINADDHKRKIAEYNRQKGKINHLLNANIDYEACILLKKIQKDVQAIFPILS